MPLRGGIASSSALAAKTSRGQLTARLAVRSLAPAQAGEVRLDFHLRRPSGGLSYLLERKRGAHWTPLRGAELSRRVVTARVLTVKQLFGPRPIRAGRYRLRLRSGRSGVTLRFVIFAAKPVKGATSVSAGGTLTCILRAGDGVDCWGYNLDGELGNGTMRSSKTPVAVSGLSGAIAVSSGYKHACALFEAGTISCWGNNHAGELGNGTLANSATPVAVGGLGGVIANSSGAAHNCAVISGGNLYCWGDNEVGELGLGTLNRGAPYGISSPVQVETATNVVGVSAGFLNTCVLISGGSIDCWGYNRDGQVGDGTVNHVRPYAAPSPARVSGITDAVSISAGYFHTCALITDGTVTCWGYIVASDFAPTPLLDSALPQRVPDITNAKAISAGGFHTCALIVDGTVKCWGADQFGQLGDGKLQDSAKPVTVIGIKHAVSISSGVLHTCAILTGGTVECWGDNGEGELGTGTLTASSVPLSVVQPSGH